MRAIVNIYYIIVNSNQTSMPVSQKKKIVKISALSLTHAVQIKLSKNVINKGDNKKNIQILYSH